MLEDTLIEPTQCQNEMEKNTAEKNTVKPVNHTNECITSKDTWYCYLLRNTSEQYKMCTYNGSTNDLKRRLRQHNEEIKGGAKATHGKNNSWEYYALLTGFQDHINCLSCEWRFKLPSGKPGKREARFNGPVGRILGLNQILHLEYWTSKCIINNRDCKYTLIIVEDVVKHLDKNKIPDNIEIIVVSRIL